MHGMRGENNNSDSSEQLEQTKLENLRTRLDRSLSARFLVRFHAALIIGWAMLVTWLFDVMLLTIGVTEMLLRYPIAILAGYVGFLVAVRVWLDYSGVREYLNHRRAQELLEFEQPINKRDSYDLNPLDFTTLDGEGCLIMLALIMVIAIVGMFLGLFATPILVDVVLEVMLAAGLIKGLRRAESSGWVTGAWQATRAALFVVLFAAIIFAAWAKIARPGTVTMSQAVSADKSK